MKQLVTNLALIGISSILLLTVIYAQAQSSKQDILGKWSVTKTEYLDENGKLDATQKAETPKETGYKVSYHFHKNGICNYRNEGKYDADIRDYNYTISGNKIILTECGNDYKRTLEIMDSKTKDSKIFIDLDNYIPAKLTRKKVG